MSALAGKIAELSYLKSIKIRRNPCLESPTFFKDVFDRLDTVESSSEMRFNVRRSPRASQSTTDWEKYVVLNRIKPNPILYSWVGPKIVEISQLFKLFYGCKSLELPFCLTLRQKQLNFSKKPNSCLFIIIFIVSLIFYKFLHGFMSRWKGGYPTKCRSTTRRSRHLPVRHLPPTSFTTNSIELKPVRGRNIWWRPWGVKKLLRRSGKVFLSTY